MTEPVADACDDLSSQHEPSLLKLFRVVGPVLGVIVTVRGVGAVLSALDVPVVHAGGGPTPGIVYSVPTFMRLQYGTEWADLVSGLMLLASVGLVAFPYVVWEPEPRDQWRIAVGKQLQTVGLLAALGAIADIIEVVNLIWHWHQPELATTELLNLGVSVAAATLMGLTATFAWLAVPFTRGAGPARPSLRSSDEVNPYGT